MALIFKPFLPITLPMRLCEMRRRMAVVGEEELDVTGEEGLAETSWDTMREYACALVNALWARVINELSVPLLRPPRSQSRSEPARERRG